MALTCLARLIRQRHGRWLIATLLGRGNGGKRIGRRQRQLRRRGSRRRNDVVRTTCRAVHRASGVLIFDGHRLTASCTVEDHSSGASYRNECISAQVFDAYNQVWVAGPLPASGSWRVAPRVIRRSDGFRKKLKCTTRALVQRRVFAKRPRIGPDT